ncbi:hypothetical protein IFM89_017586 [Coptis chinensis]|uniref:Uncharacterized protein n=1 Tax=Coptis chinensis TaxID=261450 RepID=A0A835HWA2_9MAGN|nr:hypothetical protein IFM89_017586 [Coptis chinensis]
MEDYGFHFRKSQESTSLADEEGQLVLLHFLMTLNLLKHCGIDPASCSSQLYPRLISCNTRRWMLEE